MKLGLGFIDRPSVIHRLTGTAKLTGLLAWSTAAMISYDTRVLAVMFISSIVLFSVSKIRLSDVAVTVIFILSFLCLNNIAIFIFSPEEGVALYGTRHVLLHIAGRYTVTAEQLFYMLNISLKYFTVTPAALLFITTTNPSEFASSLNRIGVNYKIAYSVALALRYIPDVQRDYHTIAQAQQARGIDISRKEKLPRRIKNAVAILLPLIMQSLSRIDVISSAMELRGFGKKARRTWYSSRPFAPRDYAAVIVSALLLAAALAVTFSNGSRFYNPFIPA